MTTRKKRAIFYLVLILSVVGLYAWYVRGLSFERLFPFGQPKSAGDAEHGRWFSLAAAPTARTEVGAAELSGKLYVVGGLDGLGQTLSKVEAYNPKTDRWEAVPDLPKALHHPSVVALEGYLYVLGGFQGLNFVPLNTVFVFDRITGIWQEVAPMPEARGGMAAAVYNGKIYVVGGDSPDGVSGALFSYSPAEDSWQILRSMPTARDHLSVAVLNDKLFVLGGRKKDLGKPLKTVEVYDFASDGWASGESLQRGMAGGAAVLYRGGILAMGGEEIGRTRDEVHRFDPEKNKWENLTPMLSSRHGFGAAVINDIIYTAAGGKHPSLSVSGILESMVFGGR